MKLLIIKVKYLKIDLNYSTSVDLLSYCLPLMLSINEHKAAIYNMYLLWSALEMSANRVSTTIM